MTLLSGASAGSGLVAVPVDEGIEVAELAAMLESDEEAIATELPNCAKSPSKAAALGSSMSITKR